MVSTITVASILCIVGISFAAAVYMFTRKSEDARAPVSQLVSQECDDVVPFSYNVPVDSHTNYKNDVVIVVEHPDDKIAIGVR